MSLSLPEEGHSDTGCDVDDSEDLVLVKQSVTEGQTGVKLIHRNRLEATGAGAGGWESLFNGDRVSILQDGRVVGTGGGRVCM